MLLGYVIWKPEERVTFSSCEQYQSYSSKRMSRVKDLSFRSTLDCISALNLNGYTSVVSITIRRNSLQKVHSVEIDGLNALRRVTIGSYSPAFTVTGSFRIVNCPKLQSIQIGDRSFENYRSFELNNLFSLQSIVIGYDCFYWAPSFSLTGLID